MQTKKHLLVIAVTLSLFSCGTSTGRTAAPGYETADSTEVLAADSSDDGAKMDDSSKIPSLSFIRTADLKFKVKDVAAATYTIEDIAKLEEGFVTYTNMASSIDYTNTTPVSEDSALEMTYYTVSNDMTIRIPNTRLDTTLKMINTCVDFMDHRTIKADDVALQILTNDLTQRRAVKTAARMSHAIDARGKKLAETTSAEELLSDKEEQSDDAFVSNRSLEDQVSYSTISLSFYQCQSTRKEMLGLDKDIEAYQPGLGNKLAAALLTGTDTLESIIVFLVQCWSVFLFLLLAYIIYKTYRKKKSKQ
jgi:Domain of unknown function (DUF4349)